MEKEKEAIKQATTAPKEADKGKAKENTKEAPKQPKTAPKDENEEKRKEKVKSLINAIDEKLNEIDKLIIELDKNGVMFLNVITNAERHGFTVRNYLPQILEIYSDKEVKKLDDSVGKLKGFTIGEKADILYYEDKSKEKKQKAKEKEKAKKVINKTNKPLTSPKKPTGKGKTGKPLTSPKTAPKEAKTSPVKKN